MGVSTEITAGKPYYSIYVDNYYSFFVSFIGRKVGFIDENLDIGMSLLTQPTTISLRFDLLSSFNMCAMAKKLV